MKKCILILTMILATASTFAQESKDVRKQEKADKKVAKMEKDKHERHGKKTLRSQDKADKKEAALSSNPGK